jgi:hypothetical protein
MASAELTCSFATDDLPCGLLGTGSTVVPLDACLADMTGHLVSLQVTGKRGRGKSVISEKQLILNRAGFFNTSENETKRMTICPRHRKLLTIDWQGRKNNSCTYPAHKGQRVKSTRRINELMSMEIHRMFNEVVPIGSGKKHCCCNQYVINKILCNVLPICIFLIFK